MVATRVSSSLLARSHLTAARRASPSLMNASSRRFLSTATTSTAADEVDATNTPVPHYDVVIVGGGIVGSALACQLKGSAAFRGKRVAVIESAAASSHDEKPDLRAFTITPASKALLKRLGVWQKIPADKQTSFTNMQVWDAMGDGFIRFDAAKAKRPALGHVVEHPVLVRALHERMGELCGADAKDSEPLTLYCPAKLKHYTRPNVTNGHSAIGLADGQRLTADLVVAADGGKSMIRTLSALGTWGWDYDQQAVVATVKTATPNTTTAWQRFFPTGPIALLPLRDGYSSIVYSCSQEMAQQLLAMSSDELVHALNTAFQAPSTSAVPPSFPGLPVLGDVVQGVHHMMNRVLAGAALADPFVAPPVISEVLDQRVAFPLKLTHATNYTKAGVALVGDSAHTMHPLAGQGLNMGLADVQALGDLLIEGTASGEFLGNPYFLTQYDENRKKANISMALAMDGFKRLFGPQPDAVGVARNVGMGTLNAVEPLKNQIMRYAMGL